MGSIRTRKETNTLYIDFRYREVRCREQTTLTDTIAHRNRLKRLLKKIEKEIAAGTFSYRQYFPNSKRAELFEPRVNEIAAPTNEPVLQENTVIHTQASAVTVSTRQTPVFAAFADQWFKEKEIAWKRLYRQKVAIIINAHLVTRFKGRQIHEITKAEILNFRVYLAREYRDGKGLSPSRINQIISLLQQILEEASDRYGFATPFRGIKPLRVPRTQVDPFSFDEVRLFLEAVPTRYRNYFTVAFFTGMRTSELIGLKKQYVDFVRNEIQIKETWVAGHLDTPKTDGSERIIQISSVVVQALKDEMGQSDLESEFVFHSKNGQPLNYRNLARRVWYPTLEKACLKRRRPYQSRHTAATLWLAAGENPEWIARQMGHTTTKMLFTVYSRYVPDLTRKDGSAIEKLLEARFGTNG